MSGIDFGKGDNSDHTPEDTAPVAEKVTIIARGRTHVLDYAAGRTVKDYVNQLAKGDRPGKGLFGLGIGTSVTIGDANGSHRGAWGDTLQPGQTVTITKNTMNG